jgi:hypothetical protein
VGREEAMEAQQMEPGRRNEHAELFDQTSASNRRLYATCDLKGAFP